MATLARLETAVVQDPWVSKKCLPNCSVVLNSPSGPRGGQTDLFTEELMRHRVARPQHSVGKRWSLWEAIWSMLGASPTSGALRAGFLHLCESPFFSNAKWGIIIDLLSLVLLRFT